MHYGGMNPKLDVCELRSLRFVHFEQVFWGPLGFFIAYSIAVQHPARYALQIVISLGQLYGDFLYYATSLFDLFHYRIEFSRPENYYFWVYYFFMNFIWIVIPTCKS